MSVSRIYPVENKPQSEFEILALLAQTNPVEFEKKREEIIRNFIDSNDGPKKERLIRFQWRIDQTRRQAKNPYQALMKINEMMWESLIDLKEAQNQLVDFILYQKPMIENNCEIIDFKEYRK